jgi:hypothetical protein
MSHIANLVQESVHDLFATGASRSRFKRWKDSVDPGVATVLGGYAFGEIVWKKQLGRPNTIKLSDGFSIEAWRDDMVLVGDIGAAAHWQPLHTPYQPSWWDGQEDAEHWRVSFMVPDMKAGASVDGLTGHSTYTHIVLHFQRGVSWLADGGPFRYAPVGLRVFDPPHVVFVKPQTFVYFSFEVVLTRALVFP